MQENFKAREKLLNIIERNLEIRQNVFSSLRENSTNKFFKWIKRLKIRCFQTLNEKIKNLK
jgi:hypothetical protein